MTKLIRNWEELAKVPANDKYRIIVDRDMCSGWIVPVGDEPDEEGTDYYICHCKDDHEITIQEYFKNHVYLSTLTFYGYGDRYKESTRLLQEHGFDVEIDNWDKEK